MGGALFAAAKAPRPAAADSFQLAVPRPTKSRRFALAAKVGVPPEMAVVEATSAILASVLDIAIVPVACAAGLAGTVPAGSDVPAACCTRRYWPGPSTTAGSAVTVQVVPVEDAYCVDQPVRFCDWPPAL